MLKTIDGNLVLRTVYPSLAREQSCVSCHNQLQQEKVQWQLNDVMGAPVIDNENDTPPDDIVDDTPTEETPAQAPIIADEPRKVRTSRCDRARA